MNELFESQQLSQKEALVRDIVTVEWAMFDKVNGLGGRASCQEDPWTFYVMRCSQFLALPLAVLESYQQDLQRALREGRNLLTEKYAYMMEYSDPVLFASSIREQLPSVSLRKQQLVDEIVQLLIKDERAFALQYPNLHRKGRPLQGAAEGMVSVSIYALGELKTYSEKTLELYAQHLRRLDLESGENISVIIHRMMVRMYGYRSLEEAEEKASED